MPLPQQAPPGLQHEPGPQDGPASEKEASPPLEMAPAPPLMSLFTLPPHSGQTEIGASDIFCRRSKWQLHTVHLYS